VEVFERGRPVILMRPAGVPGPQAPWAGIKRGRNDSSSGGKSRIRLGTWLPAGSPWSCVSGTFTSTVRQFCLIFCAEVAADGRRIGERRPRIQMLSFRSNRVGRARDSLPSGAPAQSPGGRLPTDTQNQINLGPGTGGEDRRERKTFWCCPKQIERKAAHLPRSKSKMWVMQTAAFSTICKSWYYQPLAFQKVPACESVRAKRQSRVLWNDVRKRAVCFISAHETGSSLPTVSKHRPYVRS